jgi:hypothetical protein
VCYRTVSGAPPDNVRCTRALQLKLFTFGFSRRSSAIIHRTVRCTSGVTAICAQRSTLQSEQCCGRSQSSGQRGTGLSGLTPDCPVPHEDSASNGRPAPGPNDRMTWRRTGHCPVAHRTVRCALRQQTSPTARFWLVAINITPTGHFKVREPKCNTLNLGVFFSFLISTKFRCYLLFPLSVRSFIHFLPSIREYYFKHSG